VNARHGEASRRWYCRRRVYGGVSSMVDAKK
jgi:hypothetical protein